MKNVIKKYIIILSIFTLLVLGALMISGCDGDCSCSAGYKPQTIRTVECDENGDNCEVSYTCTCVAERDTNE